MECEHCEGRGIVCDWCGEPFGDPDDIILGEDEAPYCSEECKKKGEE